MQPNINLPVLLNGISQRSLPLTNTNNATFLTKYFKADNFSTTIHTEILSEDSIYERYPLGNIFSTFHALVT